MFLKQLKKTSSNEVLLTALLNDPLTLSSHGSRDELLRINSSFCVKISSI